MDGRGVAERALTQTREQLRLIVPRGEIERDVEPSFQVPERILVALDRLSRAGGEAGGNV
jgi:hypothetical protein